MRIFCPAMMASRSFSRTAAVSGVLTHALVDAHAAGLLAGHTGPRGRVCRADTHTGPVDDVVGRGRRPRCGASAHAWGDRFASEPGRPARATCQGCHTSTWRPK